MSVVCIVEKKMYLHIEKQFLTTNNNTKNYEMTFCPYTCIVKEQLYNLTIIKKNRKNQKKKPKKRNQQNLEERLLFSSGVNIEF